MMSSNKIIPALQSAGPSGLYIWAAIMNYPNPGVTLTAHSAGAVKANITVLVHLQPAAASLLVGGRLLTALSQGTDSSSRVSQEPRNPVTGTRACNFILLPKAPSPDANSVEVRVLLLLLGHSPILNSD